MKKIIFFTLIGLFIASSAFAAEYCVRDGANGNGSNWDNALGNLPDPLERGSTYYIADGTYPSYTFDDPIDGEQYIYIKKATAEEGEHGTENGWQGSYGDGVATFTGKLVFSSDYYVIDGVYGEGYGPRGIKVDMTSVLGPNIAVGTTVEGAANHIVIKYVHTYWPDNDSVLYMGEQTTSGAVEFYYSEDITIQNCFHELTPGYVWRFVECDDVTIERNHFYKMHNDAVRHASALTWWRWNDSPLVFRYNYMEECEGTGCVTLYGINPGEYVNRDVLIYGNVFKGIMDETTWLLSTNDSSNYVESARVYNNTIINANGYGTVGVVGEDVRIYNNLWYINGNIHDTAIPDVSLRDYNIYSDCEFRYAHVPNSNETPVYDDGELPHGLTSTLDTSAPYTRFDDDQFVDWDLYFPQVGDVSLMSDSEAIDAGVNWAKVTSSTGTVTSLCVDDSVPFMVGDTILIGSDPSSLDEREILSKGSGDCPNGEDSLGIASASVATNDPVFMCLEFVEGNPVCPNDGDSDGVINADVGAYEFTQAYYVREGASPGGDGSDWDNAFTTLPYYDISYDGFMLSGLERGATYYIADGDYPSYAFGDAEDGEKYITIKKATIESHGTDAGWDDSFGNGQASFGPMRIQSSYWTIDGQVGYGDGSVEAHGFYIDSFTSHYKGIYIGKDNTTANNLNLFHIEIEGVWDGDSLNDNDGIYVYNDAETLNNFHFSHLYIHDNGRAAILPRDVDNMLVEYCYFATNESTHPREHSEPVAVQGGDNHTYRYNYFYDAAGTGSAVVLKKNDDWETNENMLFYGNIIDSARSSSMGVFGHSGDVGEPHSPPDGIPVPPHPITTNAHTFNNVITRISGWNAGSVWDGFSPAGTNIHIKNNIWYDNLYSPYGENINITFSGSTSHTYNGYFANTRSDSDLAGLEPGTAIYSESENPFFNVDSKDFTLASGASPIDKGTHLTEIAIADTDTDVIRVDDATMFLVGDTILITSGQVGDEGQEIVQEAVVSSVDKTTNYLGLSNPVTVEEDYRVFMCHDYNGDGIVVRPNDGDGDGIIKADMGVFEFTGEAVCNDNDDDGYTTCDGDCDDSNPYRNPGADEIPYNGIDDDCTPATPDVPAVDNDNDGYDENIDCNDNNPSINPGANEIPYDGIDNDCNPATPDDDLDGDGYYENEDCDDNDPYVNPGANEICDNGIDDDCDGEIDEEGCVSIEEGLIAHYEFEGNFLDSSGNIHNGNNNGVDIALGKIGEGADFTSGDYVDVGNFDVIANELTIAAWINSRNMCSGASTSCDARIISKADGVQAANHWWMLSGIKSGNETRLRFRLKTNGTTDTLIAGSGNIENGVWTHVAAVYDGSSMILYKDGVEVGIMGKSGTISTGPAADVWIGNNPLPGEPRPYDGLMDDVRVYDQALTAYQINQLVAAVEPGDQSPELSPIGDRSTNENQQLEFSILATDPDGDSISYSAANLPEGASFQGATFSWTPGYNQAGTYPNIFFMASAKGLSDSETITVNVNNVNRAPVANAQSVTTAEDTTKNITLTGSDADGDDLTYSIVANPANGSLSGSGANRTYTPADNYNGSDSFSFNVNDGRVDSIAATITITVTAVNDAPIITNLSDPVYMIPGENLSFPVDATDVDSLSLTYSKVSGPGSVSASGLVTYDNVVVGTHQIVVKVVDTDGLYDQDTLTVVAEGSEPINLPPVFRRPLGSNVRNVDVDRKLSFMVRAVDPEGAQVNYPVPLLPEGADFEIHNSFCRFTWTPTEDQAQVDPYVVTFIASDGENQTSKVMIINVIGDIPEETGGFGLEGLEKEGAVGSVDEGEDVYKAAPSMMEQEAVQTRPYRNFDKLRKPRLAY